MSSQPVLYGADGVPCEQCGSPLAADQRYCMACGARRAEVPGPVPVDGPGTTLVPYGQVPSGPVASAVPVQVTRAGTLNDGLRRNAPLLGLTGVLLLAMLIGVLLGHWATGGGDATAQAPPQVISVGAAAPAPAVPVATTPAPAADAAGDEAAEDEGEEEDGAGAEGSDADAPEARAPEREAPVAPPPPKALRNIDSLSGEARQKAVDALPKKVSTGGKAPPKDNKAPAAGGDFEEIG
jgi:hypothetical protein